MLGYQQSVEATHDLIFLGVKNAKTVVVPNKDNWNCVPAEGHSTSELPQMTMVANTIRFRKGEYGREQPIPVDEIGWGPTMERVCSIRSEAVRSWLTIRTTPLDGGMRVTPDDWDEVETGDVALSVGLVKRTPSTRRSWFVGIFRQPRLDPVTFVCVRSKATRDFSARVSMHDYRTGSDVRVAVLPCVCGRYVPAFGVDGVNRILVRDTGSRMWGCVQINFLPSGAPMVSGEGIEEISRASERLRVPYASHNFDWLSAIAQWHRVKNGWVSVSPCIDNNRAGLVSIQYTGEGLDCDTPSIVASERALRATVAAANLTPEPFKYMDMMALSTIWLRRASVVVDAISWVYVVLLCTIIPTLGLRGALLLSGEVVAEVVGRVVMPLCLLYDGYSGYVALEGILAPIAASMRYFCSSGPLVRALWTSPIFLEVTAGAFPLMSMLLGDSDGGVFKNGFGAAGGIAFVAIRWVCPTPVIQALGLQAYVFLYLWNLALQAQVLIQSGQMWTGCAAIVLNLPEALIVMGMASAVLYNGSDKEHLRQMIVDRTPKGLLTYIGVSVDTFSNEQVLAVRTVPARAAGEVDTARLYWVACSELIKEDFRGFSLRRIGSGNAVNRWAAHTQVTQVGQGLNVQGLGSALVYGGLVGLAGGPSSLMNGCTSEVLSRYYGEPWGGMVTASSSTITLPLLSETCQNSVEKRSNARERSADDNGVHSGRGNLEAADTSWLPC